MHRTIPVLTLLSLISVPLLAQGLETRASKGDWEEINFEYNSAVLSDGYPSLLRLAELLSKNPGYHVRIEGHTDGIGSKRANEKLGMARANTVRDFLVKYGAKAEQIQTMTRGEADPEARPEKKRYSKTDVARWMNRRVVLTVTDEQGKTVSDGGVNQAIQAMDQSKAMMQQEQQCCDQILKRLDRLDEIAKMLHDMSDQNNALKQEVADLKAKQSALEQQISGLPKPLNEQQTAQVVDTRLEKFRDPRFSILAFNIGADSNRDITFTGKARYFAPFKDHFAIQAQGEYLYFHDMKEGQFDLGLVDRIGNFQAGLFSSFKHVSLSGMQSGGTLGQASMNLDYIFSLGRVGLFGTRAFLNDAVVNSAAYQFVSGTNPDGTARMTVAPNLFTETYLKVVDQIGLSTTLGLWGNNYLEANLGYLKSFAHADRPGGTVRFVFPVMNRLAFTVEGGMNETLLAANNWGRATVGVQFGNFTRPRDYRESAYPAPVDVPRIRWEMLTRTVRRGASPPVADAGPDQIGVAAGTITLNGSNSYDPNGEKLTYQWVQESGPSVPLNGMNQASATFTAAAGQTYVFRLTVTNESGLSSSARVRVSTQATQVQIVFFTSNPPTINSGQASQLSWKVVNATSVSISGIGTVAAQGSTSVSPTQTTTYQLTATGASGTQNATATVVVNGSSGGVQITGCTATPASISAGQSSTISFQTQNASSITVTPTVNGNVPLSGSFSVTPTQTTTYTISAAGQGGQTASCAVTVTIGTTGTGPMITSFTANPQNSPSAGSPVTLTCLAQNATNVSITGAGALSSRGTVVVNPTTDTLYTCVATGANGAQDTRSVQVRVGNSTGQGPQVVIIGAPLIITSNTDLILDASGSRSPFGWEPLSFRWKSVGPLFADIDNERTARALVHLIHGPGDYNFEVYVMDRHGNVTVGTVLVRLIASTTTP